MRRTLGTLLTLTVLAAGAACGSDQGDEAKNPPIGGRDVESTEVALLSSTAAGGKSSEEPAVLDDAAAVDSFVGQFKAAELPDKVRATVDETEVPDGEVLVASVVSIGCDVPPGVEVHENSAGLVITPKKVAKPLQECIAPVTTVAVMQVDADAV